MLAGSSREANLLPVRTPGRVQPAPASALTANSLGQDKHAVCTACQTNPSLALAGITSAAISITTPHTGTGNQLCKAKAPHTQGMTNHTSVANWTPAPETATSPG